MGLSTATDIPTASDFAKTDVLDSSGTTPDTAADVMYNATSSNTETISAGTTPSETNVTTNFPESITNNKYMEDNGAVLDDSETTDSEEFIHDSSETMDITEPIHTNSPTDYGEFISDNGASMDTAEDIPSDATTHTDELNYSDYEEVENTGPVRTNSTTMDTDEPIINDKEVKEKTESIVTTETDTTARAIPNDSSSSYESTERCNKAAHFEDASGQCVCNNPEMDAKKINPMEFEGYSEGAVCYSCQDANSTTAVVFILDESGTVSYEGWKAQKTFMQQILKLMGDIKVGIVVIAGDSYVAVPLNDYSKNKEAIDDFVEKKRWGKKWTSIGVALYRARKMLEDSTADSKNIIIFSDGDRDACEFDTLAERCPQWKKDNIKAHSQEAEARKIHKLGISVTFVAVNFERSTTRIRMIAGKPRNIVKIGSFTDLNTRALNGVIRSVCKAEKLTEN